MQNSLGMTPLLDASSRGLNQVVQTLLKDPRTDVNIQNVLGVTALYEASFSGHKRVVRILLRDLRTDVNIQDLDGWAAINAASFNGLFELMKAKLQDQWADDSWTFNESYRRHKEVIKLLLRCRKTDVEMLRYHDFVASFMSYFHNFPSDAKFRWQFLLDWVGQRANVIGLSVDAIESRERLIRDLGETCPN